MSHSDWEKYPNQIRGFRKKRSLRLWDIALLIGIRTAHHVSRWESGGRIPSLESALRLSAALRCPVEVLFCDHFRKIREEVNARQERHNIVIHY
jgi:transcriptional regulator with XRE-family HTH domain